MDGNYQCTGVDHFQWRHAVGDQPHAEHQRHALLPDMGTVILAFSSRAVPLFLTGRDFSALRHNQFMGNDHKKQQGAILV
jgi:hypothetical protein